MKKIKSFVLLSAIAVIVIFFSCKKDPSTTNTGNGETNKPPIANAGPDQNITLPVNTASLDGSLSSDPDNNIRSFSWTYVSGPLSYTIGVAIAVNTQITNLVEGIYQFELRVTDGGGLSATDTVKINVNPDPALPIEWQKALGGSAADLAFWVQPTTDGGYILAGSTESQNGDISGYHIGGYGCYVGCDHTYQQICGYYPDALVAKLNSTGAIQWQKSLGGTGADVALCIQPTADGGYVTSGYTFSKDGDVSGYHVGNDEADAWVVKLNSSGNIQWQKALGGTGCDYFNRVLPTQDGGFILAGHSDSDDGDLVATKEKDIWIVKLSSSGDIAWQKTIGGTNDEFAYALQLTFDGGYIVAGNTYSNDGDVSGFHGGTEPDAWVVKLSSSGTIEWQKVLGGTLYDCAKSIQPTSDGGYILAGETKSNDGNVNGGNHGGQDAWVIKLSSSGAIQWQKALGGSNNETSQSLQLTTDGSYILAGYATSFNGDVNGNHGQQDIWVVKLSSSGAIQWQKALGGTNNENAQCIQPTTDGGYIVSGRTLSNDGQVSGNHGNSDAWVVKLKK